MNSILVSFLKKTAYAVIANILAMLALGLGGHVPAGSILELQIYAAIAAVLTGLVAAAKRWIEIGLGGEK